MNVDPVLATNYPILPVPILVPNGQIKSIIIIL